MSLVAIDALWIEESNQYSHYFDHRRITEIAVDEADLKATLENYLLGDSAPRVRTAVETVFAKYHIE